MDELDNDVLPLILILDDKLFPRLLDYSLSKGWSDLILFLLETDFLRFKSNGKLENDLETIGIYEPYHLILQNKNNCFEEFVNKSKLQSLQRLINSGIPLNSIYSQLCEVIWKEVLKRSNDVINCNMWPSVRKAIVDDYKFDIEEILDDPIKRKYFERFIQDDPSDLASLHCLLNVRRVLSLLKQYKVIHGRNTSLNSNNVAIVDTELFDNKTSYKTSSIMRGK